MRILHIFRAPLGGLFRHVLDLAREQVARGHDVGIFCDSTTGGTRADELLAELAPKLTLGLTRQPIARSPSPSDAAILMRLSAVCRETQPDILHGHGAKGGAYARLVPWRGNITKPARGYTPHGGSFNYFPGSAAHRIYMTVERWLADRTDVFLCESAFIAGRVRDAVGNVRQPLHIVHNGITAEECAPIVTVQDPVDFLYLGEFRFAKGIDTLLDAMRILRDEHQLRPSLLLVGSGPEEDALRARVAADDFTSQASFLPPSPIRSVLARARIMVVPSRAESLPYVILEAAGAAQPLVATNVGGIPEIFGAYAHRLIPSDNAPVLADTMRRALERPTAELAQEAKELASYVREHFSIQNMVDGVEQGYSDGLHWRNR